MLTLWRRKDCLAPNSDIPALRFQRCKQGSEEKRCNMAKEIRRSLLSFDTDRIKEYVFATNALAEIRGASHILDKLNRETMRRTVAGECIYAHGGSGLFVVPKDAVPDCIAQTERAYAEETGGAATITGAALDLPAGFDVERDDVRHLWKHLGYKLQAAKSRNPLYRTSVTHPFLRYSDSDGTHYASEVDSDDPARLISYASALKNRRNRTIREKAAKRERRLPQDFAAIAGGTNYFALIYADGDGLGQALDACETLPQIKETAQCIDETLRHCKEEALAKYNADTVSDTLLHGGDDLVLAVPSDAALDVSLYITEAFKEQTEKALGRAYTVSTAIVWAHPNFPFRTWLDITESALKFAKREGAKRGHTGLINFLVISSANHLAFERYYKEVLTTEETGRSLVRTLRPYTACRLRKLIAYREQLAGMSRSKLADLRHAVFQSQSRAIFEALRVLTHWRDQQHYLLNKMVRTLGHEDTEGTRQQLLFPFMQIEEEKSGVPHVCLRTPIADLAELWDFTGRG